MNFKKRVNGSWTDIPHYIHKTSTDTLTTLPAVIYPNAATATVGLKGNMSQTGTPTPQNPVIPQGTGERTGNLWDNLGFSAGAISTSGIHMLSNNYGTSLSTVSGGSVDITQVASGNTAAYQNGFFFIEIDISQFSIGDAFVIGFDYEITNKAGSTSTTASYVGQGNTSTIVTADWSNSGRAIIKATVTSAMTKPYVEIRLCGNSIKVRNVQVNLGSTALPYEPYGYKLDISSASTATPVYLGEVESTRQIKKYVFTGSETWSAGKENYYSLFPQTYGESVPYSAIICSHCSNATINNTGKAIFFKKTDFPDITTGEELKQYCSDQYAAGMPVTVWYVLAEPTTGIVNEPLMRIGDYADTLSGISIPVTTGGDILSVGTTVQPSEVTVNYKGWHPAIVHKRINGAWT